MEVVVEAGVEAKSEVPTGSSFGETTTEEAPQVESYVVGDKEILPEFTTYGSDVFEVF